jgi:hypothetical protein
MIHQSLKAVAPRPDVEGSALFSPGKSLETDQIINRSLSKCLLGGAFVPCRFISILLPSPFILNVLRSRPIWMRRYPHRNKYALRKLRRRMAQTT